MEVEPVFTLQGPPTPRSPVVIAVPHAGRHYPAEVTARARVPLERLRALEDRHAERLVGPAVAAGATAIVARLARATIDLNRDPREIDPGMIDGPMGQETLVRTGPLLQTGKVRAGLGLFPRRLPSCGELWGRRMRPDEAAGWLTRAHEPYHRAIADRIEMTRATFGAAVLIDCHSMPPLPVRQAGGPVRIVVGDRFGAGASPAVVDLVMALIEGTGLRVARNHPYAGGYTIDRHGRPRRQVHAIQIEYDRALYLDAALDQPTGQVEACGQLLAAIVAQLGIMFGSGLSVAAE